jgi:hypothetical protein
MYVTIKYTRMKWARRVACTGVIKACKVLVGKQKGKRRLRRKGLK